MTQLELIELIQQHHPGMGHKAIRSGLNRAQNDYCARTDLMKKTYTQTSTAGQRYYALDEDILRIIKVQINDVDIPRLIGNPIIDDDEWDGETGLTASSSSSNDRYWYEDVDRIGIVEKVVNAVTRDGKTSNYQSISEVKEMRIHAISQATDFTSSMIFSSELPKQFHEALVNKVISDVYLIPPNKDMDSHKIFYTKYMDFVKSGRAYARSHRIESATIRPVYF